jgi:hypothetical protein
VSTKTGRGRDVVYKKQDVCTDWLWKLDTCINRAGIVVHYWLVVLARGAGSCDVGVRGCHNGLLLWPWSSRNERGGCRRCVLLWKGSFFFVSVSQVGVWH